MKKFAILLITTILFISCSRMETSEFKKHFFDKTLRINVIHTGDAYQESYKAVKLYDDGLWYGRTKTLTNPYLLGSNFYELRDVITDEVIYSDGFSTFFSEWRRSDEAKEKQLSFNESIRIPYPQNNAKLIMYSIDTLGVKHQTWEFVIDRKVKATMEPTPSHNNRIIRLLDSGNPKKKVDIVILGDGYTDDDTHLFDEDVSHFYNTFINAEPYKSRKSDFNVHAIQLVSKKNDNILKTDYGTMGYDRFVLTHDEWALHEYATQSPYDFAVIMLNSSKNGGGSLYNSHITAIRPQPAKYVVRHEIGHLIAGIADTYHNHEEQQALADSLLSLYDFDEIINKVLDLYTK